MFFLSSGIAASMSFCSAGEMFPSGWIFSTPLGYKKTLVSIHEKLSERQGEENAPRARHCY